MKLKRESCRSTRVSAHVYIILYWMYDIFIRVSLSSFFSRCSCAAMWARTGGVGRKAKDVGEKNN